jgi:hypothetical protein
MAIGFSSRKAKAERDLLKMQTELSQLQLKNQELVEEYKALEKITKEGSQMSGQLEKQTLKINEVLSSATAKLGLTFNESKEINYIKKFEYNLDETLKLILAMSENKWRQHAFLDENEHLVSGEVLFKGLFSAWGKVDSKIVSLAPYDKDFLKIVPNTSEKDIYIFTPDFQKVKLILAKTWKESMADAVPGVVMGMILTMVFGLFVMLARS